MEKQLTDFKNLFKLQTLQITWPDHIEGWLPKFSLLPYVCYGSTPSLCKSPASPRFGVTSHVHLAVVQAHHEQLLQCGFPASITKLCSTAWLRPTTAASAELHCAIAGWLLHALGTTDGLAALGGPAVAVTVVAGLLREAFAADR